MCTINKSAHTKKSLETYLMILVNNIFTVFIILYKQIYTYFYFYLRFSYNYIFSRVIYASFMVFVLILRHF